MTFVRSALFWLALILITPPYAIVRVKPARRCRACCATA
jgi:hypothetical protein